MSQESGDEEGGLIKPKFYSGCNSKVACWNDPDRWDDEEWGHRFKVKVYNCWFGIFHLVNFAVLTSIASTNNLFSQNSPITGYKQLVFSGTVSLPIIVLTYVLITGLYHLVFEFIGVCWRCGYGIADSDIYDKINKKQNPWRYVQYAITWSLQSLCVSILCGVDDINSLCILILLTFSMCGLFYVYELFTNKTIFNLLLINSITYWPFVFMTAVSLSANAYAFALWTMVFFNYLFVLVTIKYRAVLHSSEYELMLGLIDFVVKTLVSWLIIGNYLN